MPPENFSLDADAENAAGEILNQMPEVQEHAIAAAEKERAASEPPPSDVANAETDDFGTKFDSALHTGTKLKNGRWRERRKKENGEPKSVVAKPGSATPANPNAVDETSARAAGAAAAGSIFMLGMMLGGEEWAPITEPINERANMERAFGDYFVAKGVTDFPPGMALTVALIGYAAPRFTMPKTRKRASSVREWVSIRVAKWKVKRELKLRNIHATVSIKGGADFNARDAILVNGKPLSEFMNDRK